MVVKAKLSFAGTISMSQGEVREIADEAVLSDLVACGYVEPIEAKKVVKPDENKRTNRRKN